MRGEIQKRRRTNRTVLKDLETEKEKKGDGKVSSRVVVVSKLKVI